MKKLEVIKDTKSKFITIDQIDLKKHLVVYGDFEEILCKCEEGYVFVSPQRLGMDDQPSCGDFNYTLEEVFDYHSSKITVYKI